MRQIPPRCLMFQGYDRTVYKTSSVIYTVIISRGALNFRFTCSFNAVPGFRVIPGHFQAESSHCRREAAISQLRPRLVSGVGSGARGAITGNAGATDPPGSCAPSPGTPRRRALSRPGQRGRLDNVLILPFPPEITG